MPPTQNQSQSLDRAIAQIDSLQNVSRSLTGATTSKDLGVRFVGAIRGALHESDVAVFLRPSGVDTWNLLAESSASETGRTSTFSGDLATQTCVVSESGKELSAVQRLCDDTAVAFRLVRQNGAPAFTETDAVTLRLFSHLFDNGYQALLSRRNEKDLIFSLNHRVLQLNSLIDTGIEVSALDAAIAPEDLALQRAASLTNAASGSVTVSGPGGELKQFAFPGGEKPPAGTHRIHSTFVFAGKTYTFELFDKESRSGVRPFDETDQLLLDALARQVHASLENRYLHAQALEKLKIEQDIQVAAAIQQRIIPAELPVIAGYDIAGINIPSKSVGGDYYDCIPLPDGRYALVIADVAGKGVPAALLVSSLHAYLSAYLEGALPLNELARRLNRVINKASTDDKFITALIVILTPETGEIESVSAGHNPAYVLRSNGTVQELSVGGLALGMLDVDLPFETERLRLERGDRLLLYTDGIPEATNTQEEMFEAVTPLQGLFLSHTPDQASTFIKDLIAAIKAFTGNAPQSDDITALYLLRR